MNFVSDNQAGAHPSVLAAIAAASDGTAAGYGEDALTAAGKQQSAMSSRQSATFFL